MSVRFADDFKYLRAGTMAFHVFVKHATEQSPGPERGSRVLLQHRWEPYNSSVGTQVQQKQYKVNSTALKQVSVLNSQSILLSLLLPSKASSPQTWPERGV